MSKRAYKLGRRGEAAEETRRRIVDATFALHTEKGIAATSMKDIAARADVSVGTVYHHFPTYEDAVGACGAHVSETFPIPAEAVLAGLETAEQRLHRLAAETFAWYERLPAFEHVRNDQDLVPSLRPFVEAEERNRLALTGSALKPLGIDKKRVAVAAALLDMSVYAALRRAGLGTADAAKQIATIILAWLGPSPVAPPARRTR